MPRGRTAPGRAAGADARPLACGLPGYFLWLLM